MSPLKYATVCAHNTCGRNVINDVAFYMCACSSTKVTRQVVENGLSRSVHHVQLRLQRQHHRRRHHHHRSMTSDIRRSGCGSSRRDVRLRRYCCCVIFLSNIARYSRTAVSGRCQQPVCRHRKQQPPTLTRPS